MLALVLAGACGLGGKKRQLTLQEMVVADPLPLAKGVRWNYLVTIKKFDPDANRETSRQLSWTMEVIDARESNGLTAYRVRGWPSDLVDFEPTPVATERTVLRSGNTFLFGDSPEPTLDGAEGWFSWPVIDGQKICPRAEMVYCWNVSAVDTGYALSFYTGPDEQTYQIEPGTGISRYRYVHHGTTNEVEARLVSTSQDN